jgi:undecaprenyl diphosphate synthase
MEIYERFLSKESATFHEKKTRLTHSGRADRIPPSLADLIQKIVQETAKYTQFTLNFALDSGGRDEVVRAVRKVADPASLTEETFRQYLDHPELPDVDLAIRTSGEQRTSGFFIWQSAYAEWIFNDKYFPDLTPQDLESALAEYDSRQRRFGK